MVGQSAKLCFIGHALMENRSGLIVDTRLTAADGHAERIAALAMIEARAVRTGRSAGFASARASLRSVLFGIVFIAAFACRVSMQIAGRPAPSSWSFQPASARAPRRCCATARLQHRRQ